MARTSDDYQPCVAMWPDGQERKASVYYIRLMEQDNAVDALKLGRIAFVSPDDVAAVREKYTQKV